MHCTGAALGNAAAEFRAGHAKYVTENPEQRHVGRGVERFWFAVDGQFYHRRNSINFRYTQADGTLRG
jgi:hypothetical protein